MISKGWIMAVAGAALLAAFIVPVARTDGGDRDGHGIRHVLLISIDGMHALDFINCSKGISGVNGGQPYCPNLAALAETGINYFDTSTSKPSDSFPGLMALMTGGSPRTGGRVLRRRL
jgi:predicted AlkP superfamily pyrophosphatase or phosphodiesterase